MNFTEDNITSDQITRAIAFTLLTEFGSDIGNKIYNSLPNSRSTRSKLLIALLQSSLDDIDKNSYIKCCITILELIHRASIIVDDIIDGDSVRRAAPAYHIAEGPGKAALVPHLMCSIALKLASQMPNNVHRSVVCAYQDMALAQAFDAGYFAAPTTGWSSYEHLILPKTDRLFDCVFRMAAHTHSGKIDNDEAGALGQKVGQLYQIANDIFDAKPGERPKRGQGNRTVTLDVTLAMASSATNHTLASEIVGKELTLSEYEHLRKIVSSEDERALIGTILDNLLRTIDERVQLANSNWGPCVSSFCSWVLRAECWDQSIRYKENPSSC